MQFICLKEKKFHRSLAFCLVFFISFSVCFGFRSNKVKANPLVPVIESELAPIIINILSSFGIVISIPTARDFLEEEKDFCTQKALELQNHQGAVTKGIQALKEGFYVSKEFVTDVLDRWEEYRKEKSIEPTSVANSVGITFPSYVDFYGKVDFDSHPKEQYYKRYIDAFCNINIVVPKSSSGFDVQSLRDSKKIGQSFGWRTQFIVPNNSYYSSCFGSPVKFKSLGSIFELDLNHNLYITGCEIDCAGFRVSWDDYVTKPEVNKKVIDNVLEPVSSKNQGIVISPKNVEAVGKVLDPSIPDVPGAKLVDTAPISSVASTVPNVQSASDVGALDWGVPLDVPKDESKDVPKDESKDVPKDEPLDKPKESEGVDFSPFLTLGAGLKEVFPFCLPFDLIKNLHLLSAPPQAPHFDIDFKKAGLAGGDVVSIDFSQFELLAKIIRFFLTLGFIYFLIIKTRDMIRG